MTTPDAQDKTLTHCYPQLLVSYTLVLPFETPPEPTCPALDDRT